MPGGQLLAHPLPEAREIESLRLERGQGAFVVVAATRLSANGGGHSKEPIAPENLKTKIWFLPTAP